ncbi:MAG: bifunctional folylpolyglutamate synthase/dihydrofolate synthase [Dysgonomonas sp.]
MDYQETIDYLFNQLPVYQKVGGSAYKEGLDNSLALDDYLDHPHKKYKTIHIAGTNGKGSTSHLLAAILQSAGYKVGLYTSPHLIDFRERIRVDGEKISENYVVDFVQKHRSFFEPIYPSFFELTMMMAFRYFADMNVDVAVIEVGLGGRLDSTNIITPELSVITNISFDHTQFLGNTLVKIAGEKAGIIKPNIPVVIGEANDETRKVFEDKADDVGAPVCFAEDADWIMASSQKDGFLELKTKNIPVLKSELTGIYQIKNAATVLNAVEILSRSGFSISNDAIKQGFANVSELTGLMGRWQILQDKPKVICDTGHNVAGIRYVVDQLQNESFEHLHFIFGAVNDKDISNILSILPQKNVSYYFTQADISRALPAETLFSQAQPFGLSGGIYLSVKDAVMSALSKANKNDLIFIGGSNFIIAEALPIFVEE